MTASPLRPLSWPTTGHLAAVVVLAGGLIIGAGLSSPTLAAGTPVVAGLWWHWSRHAQSQALAEAKQAEVIDIVDRLIQHLKAGGSLRTALQATGGERLLDEVSAPVTSNPGRPGPGPELRLFTTTITVLVERGGPALPSLERLSDVVRSSHALRAELDLHAGQATASVAALVALPGMFIGGLILIDDSLRRFYLFELGGTVCLLGALTLSYAGWWVMHRLIASSPGQ